MKKELREIATEASSKLGWWQPWQFAEQVGPKEAAFIAAMSPQIAIELLDENESMRKQLDAIPAIVDRLISDCNTLAATVSTGKADAINDRLLLEQKERDWLTTSQETDETIASLESEVDALKIQLAEVSKVIERDDLYGVVMGCARTYAYEYSKGDVRLINAAYVRLQNNLLIAIKMINP